LIDKAIIDHIPIRKKRAYCGTSRDHQRLARKS